MTHLQKAMLRDIQEGENDGLGMGYSEFDGEGLTPQEKAEWEFKTAVGVAEQLKELKLPETYIEGGKTGQTGNLLESLIGADLAKSMIQKKK